MGADTWFRSDLIRILRSKQQAARRDIADPARLAGYLDALLDLAVDFGIELRLDTSWWRAGDGNLVGDGNETPVEHAGGMYQVSELGPQTDGSVNVTHTTVKGKGCVGRL